MLPIRDVCVCVCVCTCVCVRWRETREGKRWGEGEGEREVLTVTKQLLFKNMKHLESLVLSNTLNFPFVKSMYYAVF